MMKEEANLDQKYKDSKQVRTKFKEICQDLDHIITTKIVSKKRKQRIVEKEPNLFPMLFDK